MVKRISRSRETRQPVKLLKKLLLLNENFVLKTSRSAKTKCPGKSHLNVNHVFPVLSEDEEGHFKKKCFVLGIARKGWVDLEEGAARNYKITEFEDF